MGRISQLLGRISQLFLRNSYLETTVFNFPQPITSLVTLDQAAHLRDATLDMGWGGVG